MISFHNDVSIKQKYVNRLRQHQEMDEIIQGIGWEDGKGCAVGCTLENYDHDQYEVELGLPKWLAYLEDDIFEGLSNEDAKLFPLRFLESIPVGVDVNQIKNPLLIWILESTLDTFDHDEFPDCLIATQNVIELLKENCTDIDKLSAARAASAVAVAAADAYAYAAARAASAVAVATYVSSAAADADSRAEYSSIRNNYYKLLSEKLIALLKRCK